MVAEVVSVPGPSISLASERADWGGIFERIIVEMKFGWVADEGDDDLEEDSNTWSLVDDH